MSGEACAGCGGPIPIGARFCPACGRAVADAEGAASVNASSAGARPAISPRSASRPVLATPARSPSRSPSRRRWQSESAPWRRFQPALQLWGAFLILNGVLGLLSHAVDLTSPWVDVVATALLGTAVLACCRADRDALRPLLRRSGFDDRTWWQPIAVLVVLFASLEAYFGVLGRLGLHTEPYLDDFRAHEWPLWAAFVLVSVAPAVFEELAFRGFILERLGAVMGPREAVAVQAAMFAVLHMSPVVFPSHFVFGLLLGLLRRGTGSLYPGMAIHALWNGWVLLQECRVA